MEKQMKEAEASTFFHEHHPDHVNEEGLCPWGPRSGLGKRGNTGK